MAATTMLTRQSNTSHYRAYTNKSIDQPRTDYRYLSDTGDIRELDAWLDDEVGSGRAIGGDIETYVSGFGWVVYED